MENQNVYKQLAALVLSRTSWADRLILHCCCIGEQHIRSIINLNPSGKLVLWESLQLGGASIIGEITRFVYISFLKLTFIKWAGNSMERRCCCRKSYYQDEKFLIILVKSEQSRTTEKHDTWKEGKVPSICSFKNNLYEWNVENNIKLELETSFLQASGVHISWFTWKNSGERRLWNNVHIMPFNWKYGLSIPSANSYQTPPQHQLFVFVRTSKKD